MRLFNHSPAASAISLGLPKEPSGKGNEADSFNFGKYSDIEWELISAYKLLSKFIYLNKWGSAPNPGAPRGVNPRYAYAGGARAPRFRVALVTYGYLHVFY